MVRDYGVAMAHATLYTRPMSPTTLMTADELFELNLPDKRTELVKGVLVVREPAGYRHGLLTARLAKRLMDHVDARALGAIVVNDTGFWLERGPDTVRGPDVAFIARERAPDPDFAKYPALAPDLVVEVLSPGDRPGEVHAKVGDWLSAGCRLVWVVDPQRRVARVYRADGTETFVPDTGVLEGEDVVPGFSCRLGDLLGR
jgi:Uma2 family endonuclease